MLLLNKYYVFINYEHYQYNEQVDHLQTLKDIYIYEKSVTTFTSNDTYYEKISKYNLSSITIS